MVPTAPQHEPIRVQPSPRKLGALPHLLKLSLKLSDGYDYQLYEVILPGVTLKKVREELAVIQEPLSSTVVEEREHS
ncbi:MAG: hypothetical protein ACE5G5_12790 [Candidatus Methylomirabilales bacterium]